MKVIILMLRSMPQIIRIYIMLMEIARMRFGITIKTMEFMKTELFMEPLMR